jgi:hypothetical protein
MVAHKAIDVDDCLVPRHRAFKIAKKPLTVSIVTKDVSSFVAASGYVIKGVREFYS